MKRRTFLKTSAATAAAIGIGGCGTAHTQEDAAAKKSAKHTVTITYKPPTSTVADLLAGLSGEELAAAEAFVQSEGIDTATAMQPAETYFHRSSVQMTRRSQRSASTTDLHVTTADFSSIKATLFYITHTLDTPADDGRTYGLTCLYLYIPDTSSTAQSVDIVIDDPVSETIRALLFMHPSLAQLDAERAALIAAHIDLSSLRDIWKAKLLLTSGMSDESWYTATKLSDPDTSEAFVFSEGVNAGTSIYQFLPSQAIAASLADPLNDLIERIGNDTDLASTVKHATATSDTVNATRSRFARWKNSYRDVSSTSDITLESNASKYGYSIELSDVSTYATAFGGSDFTSDTPVVKVMLNNSYRRYIAFYAQYRDLDGNPITITAGDDSGAMAWMNISEGGTAYSDDTTYMMRLLPGPPEFYSVPIKSAYSEDFQMLFHPDANAINIYGVTVGSYGERSSFMEPLPSAMTITFDMIIPTLMLAVAAAIEDEDAWTQLVIEDGIDFVASMVEALTEVSANGGFTPEQLTEFAMSTGMGLITAILKINSGAIAEFIFGELAASEVEDSIPILGIALMIAHVASVVSELAQTSCAIANSPWVSSTQLTRSHSVNIQVLPDADNFQFPETADTVTLLLQSPHGKVSQEVVLTKSDAVGNVDASSIVDQSLFAVGASSTTEALFYTFTDVPEGGTISVSALFSSGTHHYVVGYAKLTGITNLNSPTVAFRIQQIPVTLSDQSIYAHKRKLSYSSAGALQWSESDAPTTTYNLRSDATTANQISNLLSISINDKSGALGYSFTTEVNGVFKTIVKNVSAKSDVPSEGFKSTTFDSDTNAFVLYDMFAEPALADENFLLYYKAGYYYAKSISIDPDSGSFGISDTHNYGKFSVNVTAAAYDSVHRIIAGVDSKHKRLHILPLSNEALNDADTTAWGQRQSVPVTSNAASSISKSDYNTLNDLLCDPTVAAFSPAGRLFVIDRTDANDYVRVFTAHGTPLSYTPFGGATSCTLKSESEAVTYLDLSVDSEGYLFVLKYVSDNSLADNYKLDLYAKDGTFLAQTSGIAAHKMHADYWRNVYTLNYEQTLNEGHSEPTVSIWIPPVTGGKVVSDYL